MIDHAVSEATTARTAAPDAASSLSYAILLGGLLTIGAMLYIVVTTYSNLPFWDGWSQVEVAADGHSPFAPTWLWELHNEHRLVLPKLFLGVDLGFFGARQTFLLASIFVIQLLHWLLLSWSMWVLGAWRGALWRTGVGLAAFCLFCPPQWQNFVWGFQVCFVLPQLLATAAFVTLLLYWRESQSSAVKAPSRRFLVLSVLAALGASYSLASGNLLWPLLIAAAVYLRLRREAIQTFAMAGITSIAVYLYRYATPERHADPIASLRSPLILLKYCGIYLFNSWSHESLRGGEIVALIVLGVVMALQVRTIPKARASGPFTIQLVLTILFCAGTALITATGRSNFGIEQARASRYQTVALLFWCSLGLLLLGAAFSSHPRFRHSPFVLELCLLAIFLRGALLFQYPLHEAMEHNFQQSTVRAAILTGVHDREILGKLAEPQVESVLKAVAYLETNRLSSFSEPPAEELGKPLLSIFPTAAAGSCVGFLKAAKTIDSPDGPGVRLAGWAWDTRHKQPVSDIVVVSDGVITGLGAAGGVLPEAQQLYPEAHSSQLGFFAFLPKPRSQSVVDVYAIIGGDRPKACYLDGWRQQ